MIITIDGPSGTGKSTVAKEVAKRLGFAFFDTGATYRSLAWFVINEGVDPSHQSKVVELLPRFQYDIRMTPEGDRRYFVGETDVSHMIRTQPISMAASQVAVYPEVRTAMVKIQRKYGQQTDVVFEGRDMGTVVFPDADLKIFLTASPEVRAQRRHRELLQKFPDLSMSAEDLLQEMKERDRVDTTRTISPLKQAIDAKLIDTSQLSAHQVVDKILRLRPRRKFPRMRLFYQCIHFLTKAYFKCFYRLKIYGLEHFSPGAAIIASNHASFYDPSVLSCACPEEVHFLAKSSLFHVPILGSLIRSLNSHPVAKDGTDTQTFRLMLELLSQGKKLILFPEGKRSEDGNLLPLERGLGFLVEKGHCRVIPAYIHGTFGVWPRGRKFPKLFGKVAVVFGSAIEWDGASDKKTAQRKLTNCTESAIRDLKEWAERGFEGIPP